MASFSSLSSKTTLLVVVPLTFVRTTLIPGLVLSETANLIFEWRRGRGMEDDEVVSVLRELMSSLTPRPWWTSRTFNLWKRLIEFTLRWFLNLHGQETVNEYCLGAPNVRPLEFHNTKKDKPLLATRWKGIQKACDGADINWIEGKAEYTLNVVEYRHPYRNEATELDGSCEEPSCDTMSYNNIIQPSCPTESKYQNQIYHHYNGHTVQLQGSVTDYKSSEQ